MQDVIEIGAHHGEPAAMRQTIGVQRDEHRGDDGEQAETDPGAEERHQVAPLRLAVLGLRTGEQIDDPAEQDRLGELRGGQREIGDHQNEASRDSGPSCRSTRR